MSRRRKPSSKNPAGRATSPDLSSTPASSANAREMAGKVIRAATGESRRLTGGQMAAADPLGWWFILAWSGRLALGFQECGHLTADPYLHEHWDSAVPTAVLCAECVGPGHDDRLRAHDLLPAMCGRCGQAEATHTVSAVMDTTWILGRVCASCLETHSPSSSDAA